MVKRYQITGAILNEEVGEEEITDFRCQYCDNAIHELSYPALHEDAYGEYFCEDKDCVWAHVNDTDVIEITEVKEVEEEE